MKVFTLQTLQAWEIAKAKGYLTGDKGYAHEDFKKYYHWMMEQMKKKIECYTGNYPIWFWLDPFNIGINEILQGEHVLLELDVPEDKTLLSNFDAWHVPLNDGSFEDDESISKEDTWQYIFDRDKMKELEYGFESGDLQGVVEKVDCKNIKVVKYFVSEIY